jgi:ATP-dependent Lon protease
MLKHSDLFEALPPGYYDPAFIDRLHCYLPGWEMPKTSSKHLTDHFGFITDYLGEAFHHLFRYSNRYDYVSKRVNFGADVEGRDEKAINKTVCAFLKILHPVNDPTDSEFDEYVLYAMEMRRRVKEQMNKRKGDDEFAKINLSYKSTEGRQIVVYCPESREAIATQDPVRQWLDGSTIEPEASAAESRVPDQEDLSKKSSAHARDVVTEAAEKELKEQHITIRYGDIGYSYGSIFGDYFVEAREVSIEDPYIRLPHQIKNFVRFCELAVKRGPIERIQLLTGYDDENNRNEVEDALGSLSDSLVERGIELEVEFDDKVHDREIRLDNGWVIKVGRGLDFYQKPESWYAVGVYDLDMRPCRETKVDIFKLKEKS